MYTYIHNNKHPSLSVSRSPFTLLILVVIYVCIYVYIHIRAHIHIYIYIYVCTRLIYTYICLTLAFHTIVCNDTSIPPPHPSSCPPPRARLNMCAHNRVARSNLLRIRICCRKCSNLLLQQQIRAFSFFAKQKLKPHKFDASIWGGDS